MNPTIGQDLIRNMVQINLDQRTSIDRLVQRLDSLTVGLTGQTVPTTHTASMVAMGGIQSTATGSGGVNAAATGVVTSPTVGTTGTVTTAGHGHAAVSQPTTFGSQQPTLSTVPVYTTSALGRNQLQVNLAFNRCIRLLGPMYNLRYIQIRFGTPRFLPALPP